MASNVSKAPILRAISNRNYSSAAPRAQASVDVHCKALPNKTVVAAAESALPLSRVSILFKGGSRYETAETLGASHLVRASASLTNAGSSGFLLTRKFQQIGASLSVTSDREGIAYTLEATSDKIDDGLELLANVATKQVFKPWELGDQIPRIKYELAVRPPQAIVLDLLNNAAYRTVLGNSLFVKDYNLKKLSTETLQYFVKQTLTAERSAVVGVGMSLDHLSQLAVSLNLPSGAGADAPAKYWGGEVRHEVASPLVHIAFGAESAGLKSKEALAYAVLRHALGAGPAIKYGIGAGPLGKVGASTKEPIGVSAFSAAYTDSGLFGIVLSTPAANANEAVHAAVKALSAGVSDADVARGKALVKADLLRGYESGEGVVEDIGSQALLLGSVLAAPQVAAAVDSITTAHVQEALKKIVSGKKSMASYGKLTNTPYLDQVAK